MRRLALVLMIAAMMPLTACSALHTLDTLGRTAAGGPVSVANNSKLDEQVGLTVTLAYTAASRAAALAIETGVIKDRATIIRIGQLDARAFAAVKAVRDAYLAVNSAGYLSALTRARQAVADLLAAVRGPVAELKRPPGDPRLVVQLILELTDGYTAIRLTDYRLAQATGVRFNA